MNWLKLDNDRIAVWAFDFDGNVLATNEITTWYFRDKSNWEIIETTELGSYKYFSDTDRYSYLIDWDLDSTLLHFRESADVYSHEDVAKLCKWPDGFSSDIITALENDKISPSFNSLKDVFLVKWRIFSILTARWHSPDSMERWLKLLNSMTLTQEEYEEQVENIIKNYDLEQRDPKKVIDYYLGKIVYYMWINNRHFAKNWLLPINGKNTAEMKGKAMNIYVEHMHIMLESMYKKDIFEILTKDSNWLSIGFSDDGIKNIVEVFKANVAELRSNFGAAKLHKYVHYFTWDKDKYTELELQLIEIAWDDIQLEFKELDDKLEITFNKK